LTELRLREQVREPEYLTQRQRLLLDLQGLDGSPRQTDPIEPARAALFALNQAEKRLASGDDAVKRALFAATVLNPRLLDRKLLIQTQKPFALVGERPSSSSNWRWRESNPRLEVNNSSCATGLELFGIG